jgi:hypothetical protein
MRKTMTLLVIGTAFAFVAGSAFGVPRMAVPNNDATMDTPEALLPFDGECIDPLDRTGSNVSRSENWRYECVATLPAPKCSQSAGFTGGYETEIQSNGALLIKYECRKSES